MSINVVRPPRILVPYVTANIVVNKDKHTKCISAWRAGMPGIETASESQLKDFIKLNNNKKLQLRHDYSNELAAVVKLNFKSALEAGRSLADMTVQTIPPEPKVVLSRLEAHISALLYANLIAELQLAKIQGRHLSSPEISGDKNIISVFSDRNPGSDGAILIWKLNFSTVGKSLPVIDYEGMVGQDKITKCITSWRVGLIGLEKATKSDLEVFINYANNADTQINAKLTSKLFDLAMENFERSFKGQYSLVSIDSQTVPEHYKKSLSELWASKGMLTYARYLAKAQLQYVTKLKERQLSELMLKKIPIQSNHALENRVIIQDMRPVSTAQVAGAYGLKPGDASEHDSSRGDGSRAVEDEVPMLQRDLAPVSDNEVLEPGAS